MTDALPPEELLDEIAQFIDESHELLSQGAVVQLAGLDGRVKNLCDQVLRLSQEDRVIYAEKLQELLGDLTELGATLVAQRDALGDTILSLSDRQKAHTAYRVTNVVDKKNNDG